MKLESLVTTVALALAFGCGNAPSKKTDEPTSDPYNAVMDDGSAAGGATDDGDLGGESVAPAELAYPTEVRLDPLARGESLTHEIEIENVGEVSVRLTEFVLDEASTIDPGGTEFEVLTPWTEVTVEPGEHVVYEFALHQGDEISDRATLRFVAGETVHEISISTRDGRPASAEDAGLVCTPSERVSFYRGPGDGEPIYALVEVENRTGRVLFLRDRIVPDDGEFYVTFADPDAPDDLGRDDAWPPSHFQPRDTLTMRIRWAAGYTDESRHLVLEDEDSDAGCYLLLSGIRG